MGSAGQRVTWRREGGYLGSVAAYRSVSASNIRTSPSGQPTTTWSSVPERGKGGHVARQTDGGVGR